MYTSINIKNLSDCALGRPLNYVYCSQITSTIITPCLPSPPLTPDNGDTPQPQDGRRGWYSERVEPSVGRRRPLLPTPLLQPPAAAYPCGYTAPARARVPPQPYGYFTAEYSQRAASEAKRQPESEPVGERPRKRVATDVNDLFARLVSTGLVPKPEETVSHRDKAQTSKPPVGDQVVHKVDLMARDSLRMYVFHLTNILKPYTIYFIFIRIFFFSESNPV